jgi:RNA polymerase-interacting CarD/CdnL/TRCF family regulator
MIDKLVIGQCVVHPRYGAGTVVRVRSGMSGESYECYFVIDIPSLDLTVHIPSDSVEGVQLRDLSSMGRLKGALAILSSEPSELPTDYRQRRAKMAESIEDGEPASLAEAIRDLRGLQDRKTLSTLEAALLTRTKRQLAGELALVMETDLPEAMHRVESALASGRPA